MVRLPIWRVAAAALGVLVASGAPVRAQVKVPAGEPFVHDVRPGPGVTTARRLSDYLPSLAKTPGDSDVFVLQGAEPGATVFVAGGTHANEIAGIMAATVLVEHVRVRQGRLIVLPHANNSAATWSDPQRPGPEWFAIGTASGERRFKFGARLTKPDDQGAPDPAKYHHPASKELLDGVEARNLDRAHPGRADGTLTEQMAYAIVQLLKTEAVDIALDLHEAGPESRLAWMIVANPKNIEAGAVAVLALEAAGVDMKLEPSSETFRGLSHREWGDATNAKSFLVETPSPSMVAAARTVDPVNDSKLPLARRVAVHLATVSALVDACNEDASSSRKFRLLDMPGLEEMTKAGVGVFLR
jgi:predicted deacylase